MCLEGTTRCFHIMRKSKTETERSDRDDVVSSITATKGFNFPGKTR